MMRSLYTGITGMNVAGLAMSVIGDNLANTTTTGFKKSQPIFEDLLAQNISGRASANQVGAGATSAAIWKDWTQGAMANSTRALDLAVNGQGFFMLKNRSEVASDTPVVTKPYYTRAGNFDLDIKGYIVNQQGLILQGWKLEDLEPVGDATNIQVDPHGISGNITSQINLSVNLNPKAVAHDYYLQSDYFSALGDSLNSTGAAVSFAMTVGSGSFSFMVSDAMTLASFADYLSAYSQSASAFASYATVSVVGGAGSYALRLRPIQDNWAVAVPTDGTTGGLSDRGLDLDNNEASSEVFSVSDGDSYDYATATSVYDHQGNAHTLSLYFRKDGNGRWQWWAYCPDSQDPYKLNTERIQFDLSGDLENPTASRQISVQFLPSDPPDAPPYETQTIDLRLGGYSTYGATTQKGDTYVTYFIGQDGFAPGSLEYLSVSRDGRLEAHYSNGEVISQYQLALAKFVSPQGLFREGGTLYSQTNASGEPAINPAEEGGNGTIYGNALEQSNVDMATEFVNMIVAQRAYQANAKVISTSDQLLAELMNLKR